MQRFIFFSLLIFFSFHIQPSDNGGFAEYPAEDGTASYFNTRINHLDIIDDGNSPQFIWRFRERTQVERHRSLREYTASFSYNYTVKRGPRPEDRGFWRT